MNKRRVVATRDTVTGEVTLGEAPLLIGRWYPLGLGAEVMVDQDGYYVVRDEGALSKPALLLHPDEVRELVELAQRPITWAWTPAQVIGQDQVDKLLDAGFRITAMEGS